MLTSLAEIVVDEGLVDLKTVEAAAEKADEGTPMVVSLVREYGIDEVALVAALKKRLRIKTLDPAVKIEIDSDALRELSRDDCRRLRAAPISVGAYAEGPKLLRVAMADPTDTVALAELEHLSGCVLEPALVTLSAVEEMIEAGYRHVVTKVISRRLAEAEDATPVTVAPVKTPRSQASTVPHQRLLDEASSAMQVEALVQLLVEKKLIDQDEYVDALRALMKKTS